MHCTNCGIGTKESELCSRCQKLATPKKVFDLIAMRRVAMIFRKYRDVAVEWWCLYSEDTALD